MDNNINNYTNKLLEQALSYAKRGWSVIPVGVDKKPLIAWKKFQKKRADENQIRAWFKTYLNMSIGIVTGEISHLTVVDIDPRHKGTNEAFKGIITISVKTGGGGFHYYFAHSNNMQNATNIQQGIDIRGDGGYVIAPPSGHPSGGTYEWIHGPDDTELADLPQFVYDWLQKPNKANQKIEKGDDVSFLKGVSEGSRNDAAAKVAGILLQKFPVVDWDDKVWPLLCAWNATNKPPLPEEELKTVFNSIKEHETSTEGKSDNRPSLAKEVVQAILASDIKLFYDQYKKGHISLSGDGREVFSFKSEHFRKWLAGYIWSNFDKPAGNETINQVSLILESQAMYEGSEHRLEVRICDYQDAIWYDIGDGSAIRIDQHGFSLIQKPPIIFRRFGHQSEQIIPKQGGDIKELADFVNLSSERERLLFLVFTIAAFIPGFPHPLLVLFGPQGAGKSTPLKMLKMLIDPSQLRTLSMSDNEREFIQLASHHYFLFFDNLSGLPGWMSDALARASTGDGFSKRELYTDDSDIIYSFQRTIGLNGINLMVEKADLLDRSVLLNLQRIPKKKRMEEKAFWTMFDMKRPFLLGSIFHIVSKAINIYPTIQLEEYPRMADFSRWGCAITQAMEYTSQDFIDAYYANINSQNDAALEASPVGTAVIAFMDERTNDWEGTASELLDILNGYAEKLKISTRQKLWPKDASWVVKRLNTIVPNLEESGIKYERLETHRPKVIRLTKVTTATDTTVLPSQDVEMELYNSTEVNDKTHDGKMQTDTPTNNVNGLPQEPASVKSITTVNLEQVKKREDCPDMTNMEYEAYLNQFWNRTEKEFEQLALQKVNSYPPRK